MIKSIFAALAASVVPMALIIWAGYNSEYHLEIGAVLIVATGMYYARDLVAGGAFLFAGSVSSALAFIISLFCYLFTQNDDSGMPLLWSVIYAAPFWRFILYTLKDDISKGKYVFYAVPIELLFDLALLGLLYNTEWFWFGVGFLFGIYLCRAIKALRE